MFRTQNMYPGSKNVFDSMAKTFFVSEQQNLFPQHMFPARLNWETFASATMFPQHCFLGLVHTMPDKFENAALGAKKEQKFSVHT